MNIQFILTGVILFFAGIALAIAAPEITATYNWEKYLQRAGGVVIGLGVVALLLGVWL
jgi:hypothetical protein